MIFLTLIAAVIGTQANAATDLHCTVPSMTKQRVVQEDIQTAIHRLKVKIKGRIYSLGGTIDEDAIVLDVNDNLNFFYAYQGRINGTATTKEGTVFQVDGHLDHYTDKNKNYDSLGNFVNRSCTHKTFLIVDLVNKESRQNLGSVQISSQVSIVMDSIVTE